MHREIVVGADLAIADQAEQREGPGPWRGKPFDRRQGRGKQLGCPAAAGGADVVARRNAKRPERPAMAILRPLLLEPAPIERHEVAEAPAVAVEGVLHERGIGRRHRLRQPIGLVEVERARQQQASRIVVDAIAMRPVGYRMDGMLVKPGIVGHHPEVSQLQGRQARLVVGRSDEVQPGRLAARLRCVYGLKTHHIAIGDPLPGH